MGKIDFVAAVLLIVASIAVYELLKELYITVYAWILKRTARLVIYDKAGKKHDLGKLKDLKKPEVQAKIKRINSEIMEDVLKGFDDDGPPKPAS